jgi:SAM-dependent methyltransferase
MNRSIRQRVINLHRNIGKPWTGSYPLGFLPYIEKVYGVPNKPLHLFSGLVEGNFTVDLNRSLKPIVCANAEILPFKANSFDRIYADPPYNEQFAIHYSDKMSEKRTYGEYKPYCFMKEAFRVLEPDGLLFVLHWLVYSSKEGFEVDAVHAVNQGPNHRMRALTVLHKPIPLDSF